MEITPLAQVNGLWKPNFLPSQAHNMNLCELSDKVAAAVSSATQHFESVCMNLIFKPAKPHWLRVYVTIVSSTPSLILENPTFSLILKSFSLFTSNVHNLYHKLRVQNIKFKDETKNLIFSINNFGSFDSDN